METEHTSSLVRWTLLGIVLLFAVVILFSHHITVSRENQISEPLPTEYSNYVYKVSLQYPAEWQPNLDQNSYDYYKYSGADGFFFLSATSSTNTSLNTLANNEKSQYGADATVTTLSIDGQSARLIMPAVSTGASGTGRDQAELIVQYPKPVVISGKAYNYLVIEADTAHIEAIAKSVKLIK